MLTVSGRELARRIRSGELTSREVVQAHVEHARRVNPRINAIVVDRYDAALDDADGADRVVKETDPAKLPPYHGVPCTVKETFAFTGMPNTAGLVSRVGRLATVDAVTVTRLRGSGAIPLGVTNTSELAMWYESDNHVYGRTNNPYDLGRMVGGSSGGEGAAVGAGMSPFGLGSDIGGSIRLPAFFNGVFGHKPSGGLVPSTGQFPLADNDALRYQCTGPIARRAEDLMPLLRLLAGPDGVDSRCEPLPIGDPADVVLDGLDVVVIESSHHLAVRRVSPDLRAAQQRAADALEAAGARVRRADVRALRHSFDIWSALMSAARETPFRVLLADGGRFRSLPELGRYAARRSPHTFPALGLALLERWPELTPRRGRRFVELGLALKAELHELVGDGLLLYPPFPSVAPRHGRAVRTPLDFTYTAILNVVEMPVTQVPLGLDAAGLPLGVQVAAARGHDHVTIAAALELERACGGWVPPWRARAGA